jgi:hypothetical protein
LTALKQVAAHPHRDRLYQPAESVRAISVGALNPPNITFPATPPASYSRRGPAPSLGVKPDFAHIGGDLHTTPSGLFSISPDDTLISGCGTSYSAPLVARVFAALEARIAGHVAKETLIALAVHHAQPPEPLNNPMLATIGRQFAGFGIPSPSQHSLGTDDHEITLIFHERLKKGQELRFDFSWPSSLVTANNACRGNIQMTLVYSPPLNPAFGAEFVRINLDAHLRQEKINSDTGEISYKGEVKPVALSDDEHNAHYEKELIANGLKWWPIKVYDRKIKNGIGDSIHWRLVVDALTRIGEAFPDDGVPFTILLTISDPKKNAPVFNQLRQNLTALGVTIADIRTATRVRPIQQ